MPSALILVADGSEEIEFVTVYDGKVSPKPITSPGDLISLHAVLVRAGFQVRSAGVKLGEKQYATYVAPKS